MTSDKPASRSSRGRVQSVGMGVELLKILAELGGESTLSGLAAVSGVAPPKVHRYLASLVMGGLVEQSPGGTYRLGVGAMAIGLAAVRANEPVLRAGAFLPALRDRLGASCFLAIMGNAGPTVVRVEEAEGAVLLNVRLGSVLPLLASATGRTFAAFARTKAMMQSVALTAPPSPPPAQSLEQIVKERSARVRDTVIKGVSAVAAPVFNVHGDVAVVLAALGPNDGFDPSYGGVPDTALREAARNASRALGWIETEAAS